jgi:hypothetical protein
MTQTVADRAEDRRLRRFIQLRELRQTVNDAARRAHAQARLDNALRHTSPLPGDHEPSGSRESPTRLSRLRFSPPSTAYDNPER